MKILPLIKGIQNDISSSGIRLKKATTDGYSIGTRAAKIYKQGNFLKYYNITKCAGAKVINGTTREEIPYLAGAIGMFIPLPLISPLLLILGFIVRFSLPDPIFDDRAEQPKKYKLNKNV